MLTSLCPRHQSLAIHRSVRKLVTATASEPSFERKTAEALLKQHRLLRLGSESGLSHVAGHRSYALLGDAARLERLLLTWTLKQLVQKYGFTPMCVPNLVYEDVVRSCGFDPDGPRTQVYQIAGRFGGMPDSDKSQWAGVPDASARLNEKQESTGTTTRTGRSICLSGTSEIPLVALHTGKTFEVDSEYECEHLPKRYCALSRCYRAETSNLEKGLFRVHYFSKVEMVGLVTSDDNESQKMLEDFVSIQKSLFAQLGLKFEAKDMPAEDLGPAAVKKVDIEAEFPGRGMMGEISSASDCRDRQTQKLDIRYRRLATDAELQAMKAEDQEPFVTKWVHSVNGTACATPRTLLSLIESHQTEDARIRIPDVLKDAFHGQEFLQPLRI